MSEELHPGPLTASPASQDGVNQRIESSAATQSPRGCLCDT